MRGDHHFPIHSIPPPKNVITSFYIRLQNSYFVDKSKKLICSYLLEVYSVLELESEILNQMHKRIVKNFLDIVILTELRKRPMSGYDVISFVHNKFHMLLSSGTVYSNLYFLEINGLIKGEQTERRKVYTLTEHGKETVDSLLDSKERILELVLNLFIDE